MRRCSLGLLMWVGCAGPGPESALQAYTQALQDEDATEVHRLSDTSSQRAYSVLDTQDRLQKAQPELQALSAALARADLQLYAEAQLPNGRRLKLVQESGAWRIAEGGLRFAQYDTPEAALETLVRAVGSGRLFEVRAVMPEAFGARYSNDAKLRAHLAAIAPRIEAACKALGPVNPGQATVTGNRAELRYGTGRSVRFVREGSRWRVLDVE